MQQSRLTAWRIRERETGSEEEQDGKHEAMPFACHMKRCLSHVT
jgi:hypothetical protein